MPTKGLKYTYELLSPNIDIVSQEGMIMYRASVNEGASLSLHPREQSELTRDVSDRATGIWVQDDKNRPVMFDRMLQSVLRCSRL